jgi:AcrR family transcriptional regulator
MDSGAPAGRVFRGLSQEERVAQRRRQLVEAGLATFGSRGFHAVSVRDVCAEAKLTERYFYESFRNREALFLAVFTDGVERIRDAVLEALAHEPVAQNGLARAGLRAYLQALQDEPRLARILLIDVLTIGAEAGSQSRLATGSFAEMLSAIIQQLYPDLDRTQLDAQLISNGLVGASVFIAMQWAASDFEAPLERVLDHCAVFFESIAAQQAKALAQPTTRALDVRGKRAERRAEKPQKRSRAR